MFSCIFALEIVPISQLNIYFMVRNHFHAIRDLSSGTVTFTLGDEDVKDLYYACLCNSDRAVIFGKVRDLTRDLF